ncbi:MAG: tRNA-t(6)A37 methylthiotransferase [Brockia lithotrophica]|uniref:Threonylcarbamoyladenosine tRNA methylthiotransferase MtaB n=1 Tax=Brockia lithotrophica TaxID=933949 RepID=A0A2T5G719_9BACL|nr:MAG: tRNA-t(6)A37 methylthiotransferase [Brockia lithotrophica]
MPKAAYATLGCKVNAYETEAIARLFAEEGYARVPFGEGEEDVELVVVNTCAVTHAAEKKSRQLVRRAVRLYPRAIVVVTGCAAQLAPETFARIPGVDVVVGTSGRGNLGELVRRARVRRGAGVREPVVAVGEILRVREYEELPALGSFEHTRAYLKVEEGCGNHCTFCTIPRAKGPVRSRRIADALREAEELVARGYREIVLTGTHLGAYGEDGEAALSGVDEGEVQAAGGPLAYLVLRLAEIPGLWRIRLSSVEVGQLDARFVRTLAAAGKVAPHFHVPLQSGDDAVLARMRRRYTTREYREAIERLRAYFPEAAVTTDVIVGFPGETESSFARTRAFLEEVGFAQLHVFPYSPRAGTAAAKFADAVSEAEKRLRVAELLDLDRELRRRFRRRFLGRAVDVLPEVVLPPTHPAVREAGVGKGEGAPTVLEGTSGEYLRVLVPSSSRLLGVPMRVRIEREVGEVLWGFPLRVLEGSREKVELA